MPAAEMAEACTPATLILLRIKRQGSEFSLIHHHGELHTEIILLCSEFQKVC